MRFPTKADPFYDFLVEQNVVSRMSPSEWWRSHFNSSFCKTLDKNKIQQLLTAVASSAYVERLFSTYRLVHLKLINKLGNEKATKLDFYT